jgi:hypothetical protein
MDVTTLDKNQLAGLEAACAAVNAAKKESFVESDDTPEFIPLSTQEYWDKVHADVAGKDERTESEILTVACESYQHQFDVGMGTKGVEQLRQERAAFVLSTNQDSAAATLKAQYAAAQENAKVESAALIAAGK